jgi:hypothetical protein
METSHAISIEKAWAIWCDCLKGDDENSIFQQISLMVWDTAIFRFVLESRQSRDINRLEVIYEQFREETNKWQREGVENLWRWIESEFMKK